MFNNFFVMSTRKAFHELHPIIGGLNGRSFSSERVVWVFVQLTHKKRSYYCCKDKRSVFHDIIGWYLKTKG